MLHILWEFRVRPERRREFEEHYGSDGTWAAFFRGGEGYRESILLHDREEPDRYLTIDVWTDFESYRAFSDRHAREYGEIDRRCEALTLEERCLGLFEALRASPPQELLVE